MRRPYGFPTPPAPEDRFPLGAAAVMLVLCAAWGANFSAIKIGAQSFPPFFAAAVRSTGAAVLVAAWASLTGSGVFVDRRRLLDGLIMGTLFALEFAFIYLGTYYTSASRAILLTYASPLWVALGAHLWLPDDRLTRLKAGGLALSFIGVAAVFRAPAGDIGPHYLLGDFLALLGGLFWALTTLYVKHTMPRRPMTTSQVLFYQLALSAPLLWVCSFAFESMSLLTPTTVTVLALAYQTIVVATVSYFIWFWLMRTQRATSLHSFTSFAPMFGVISGGVFLGELLPPLLWLGLALVATGTYLVNVRPRLRTPGT